MITNSSLLGHINECEIMETMMMKKKITFTLMTYRYNSMKSSTFQKLEDKAKFAKRYFIKSV